MEQIQRDLAEIKEHLGIPPRDQQTRAELEQLRRARGGTPGGRSMSPGV